MKISDVTIADLKNYAHVYFNDDDNLFTAILAASKIFISSYTGLPLTRNASIPSVNPVTVGAETITGTSIVGYTVTVTFPDKKTASSVAQTDGTWTISIPVDETLNEGDQLSITQTNSSGKVSASTIIKVGYSQVITPSCVDDYEDLTIALKVLSNEMYDNRAMTVDSEKLNFVVKTILDSHSVNLL